MKVRRVMPEEGWTPIANAAHRDYRLSWRARGLLGELLSYPDGWDITVDKLVAQAREVSDATEGRAAMRKAVGELAELGYVRYIRDVDEHGHWTTVMSVSDVPQPEPDARRTRNRTVGEPNRRSSGTSVDRTVGEPDCRETETSGDWSITRKKDTKTVTKNDQKTISLSAPTVDPPTAARPADAGERDDDPSKTETQDPRHQLVIRCGTPIDEAPQVVALIETEHSPRSIAWWRTVDRQGDLGDIVAKARARLHAQAGSTIDRPTGKPSPTYGQPRIQRPTHPFEPNDYGDCHCHLPARHPCHNTPTPQSTADKRFGGAMAFAAEEAADNAAQGGDD